MNESVREMAVADLVADVRRLSTLERDFLDRWRAALDKMSSTPQLARVFDRVKLLAAVEAQAQRDDDIAHLAVVEELEFGCQLPGTGRPPAGHSGHLHAPGPGEPGAHGSTPTPTPSKKVNVARTTSNSGEVRAFAPQSPAPAGAPEPRRASGSLRRGLIHHDVRT